MITHPLILIDTPAVSSTWNDMAKRQLTLFDFHQRSSQPEVLTTPTDTSSTTATCTSVLLETDCLETELASCSSETHPRHVINNPQQSSITQCTESSSTCIQVPDIASGPEVMPAQPKGPFPSRNFSNTRRSFNSSWYNDYSWVEYSSSLDAAFCYPCRLFTTKSGKSEKTFTELGFTDWKYAIGKHGVLLSHDKCSVHKNAMLSWEEYKRNAASGTSVANLLISNREQQIRNNRHYIAAVARCILFCCHQEIALRGHNESSRSLNKGNFLELMEYRSEYDPIVKQKLKVGPKIHFT